MKTAKFCITSLMLLLLSVQINAHELDSLEITVVLHENGDASITEMRSAIIGSQDTEGFIKLYNLGNSMQVTDFTVSDEYSGDFINQLHWDPDLKDRELKKGKCGINVTDDGVELCWGIGDAGSHHYKISYKVTNLVQSFTDCDGFYHNFYEADSTAAKIAIITIVKENGSFSKDDVIKLTCSGSSTINLINSKIVAESKSLNYGNKMILKCQFKKNAFHPVVNHKTSFEIFFFLRDLKQYLPFILLLIAAIIIIAVKIKKIMRYKKWFGVYKLDAIETSTTIPFNGDLQLCFGYFSAIEPSKAWFQNKIAAFFVRMINNGDIELLDEHRKAKIINPPAAELPSSVRISYENVYHCLLSILWENSDENHIVCINDIKINPFEKEKDIDNYNRFEDYYSIITQYPKIKCSMITPKEARSVMCLKKYLQDITINYELSTTINGISRTEYLVYECLYGITKHSDLDLYDDAIGFSNVWSKRLPREDKIKKLKRAIITVVGVIVAILTILVIILRIFGKGDDDGGGSTGGGGSGFR